jgi:hypothetical protein
LDVLSYESTQTRHEQTLFQAAVPSILNFCHFPQALGKVCQTEEKPS